MNSYNDEWANWSWEYPESKSEKDVTPSSLSAPNVQSHRSGSCFASILSDLKNESMIVKRSTKSAPDMPLILSDLSSGSISDINESTFLDSESGSESSSLSDLNSANDIIKSAFNMKSAPNILPILVDLSSSSTSDMDESMNQMRSIKSAPEVPSIQFIAVLKKKDHELHEIRDQRSGI